VRAVVAMYFAARWHDRAKSKRPLLVVALLVAAFGTLAAAIATPVLALVFLAIAAMGFKSASPLFWTIPQSGLHPLVLAPAIAIINSLGNLGGFVAPFGLGIIKETTGSVIPGLVALAAASTVAAGLVYFLKERHSLQPTDQGEAALASESLATAPAR
jgi:nitrate/nitrite transporter NarK